MNVCKLCKLCTSGSATENSILLSVLPRLDKIFNQSINQSGKSQISQKVNLTPFSTSHVIISTC